MNRENTAIRLKTIMNIRGLRQVDILNLSIPYCEKYNIKMNKSDLSQYCSGKTEPNQEKLFILGNALNVSEAWLMGFDVPMERVSGKTENKQITTRNMRTTLFQQPAASSHLLQDTSLHPADGRRTAAECCK